MVYVTQLMRTVVFVIVWLTAVVCRQYNFASAKSPVFTVWPPLRWWLCADGTHAGRRSTPLQSIPWCCYPLWPDDQSEEDRSSVATSGSPDIDTSSGHGWGDCTPSSTEVLLPGQRVIIWCQHWRGYKLTHRQSQLFLWQARQTPLRWSWHPSRYESGSLQGSYINLTAVWVRNMGIVPSSCAKVRAVSHVLPTADCTCSMAGQRRGASDL